MALSSFKFFIEIKRCWNRPLGGAGIDRQAVKDAGMNCGVV
jgi:hypothetical protein